MAARTRKLDRSYTSTQKMSDILQKQKFVQQEDSIADVYMNDKRDIGHSFMDFAGKLSPITYFEQIIDESKRDMINTGSANKVAHNNISFRRIDNFEVKFLDTINLEEESDSDMGQSYTHSGSLQFLPKTVLPKENDYFVLQVKDSPKILRLFRITLVTTDTTSFNPGYKAEFILADDGDNFVYDEWIYKSSVKDVLTYNRAYLGTGFRVLMTQEDQTLLNQMAEIIDTLNESFTDRFFDVANNTFFLSDPNFDFETKEDLEVYTRLSDGRNVGSITNNQIYYDPLLVDFIIFHSIFSRCSLNINVVAPSNIMKPSPSEYHESIFYAVEKRSAERFRRKYLTKKFVQYESFIHPLSLYKKNLILHEVHDMEDVGFLHPLILKILNQENYVNESAIYESLSEFIAEIIALYIKGTDYDAIIAKQFQELYKKKNELVTDVVHPYNKFYLYPLLTYIINDFLERKFSVDS